MCEASKLRHSSDMLAAKHESKLRQVNTLSCFFCSIKKGMLGVGSD